MPYLCCSSLTVCVTVPDRQYEVRVWAFNKQADGAAAVWKGSTDKPVIRGEFSRYLYNVYNVFE